MKFCIDMTACWVDGANPAYVDKANPACGFLGQNWRLVIRTACLVALVTLLTACVTQTVRPTLPVAQSAAAEAAQQAREAALRSDANWSLAGRIAVSNGRNGGSGRIDWQQDGARYQVSLSAPITRQSWQLSGDASHARLEGLEGGPRAGPDAALLLREATGWDIPVVALAEWVRGARAEGFGPAEVAYGLDGRLAWLQQGGWTIDYRWPEPAQADSFPSRLDARRGEATVRLIVDQWDGLE